jgi:hypothetical protein
VTARVARCRGGVSRGFAAILALGLAAVAARAGDRTLRPVAVPGTDIVLVPESARPMKRLVIGLQPIKITPNMLPKAPPADRRVREDRVRYLRRQLYWLDFELLHGGILKAAPPYASFYVAVPEGTPGSGSVGTEEEMFREYLRDRVGWSEAEIATRIFFYRTPKEITFPRDMAEPIGHDGKNRLVLAVGEDTDSWYATPVKNLVRAFPADFLLQTLPGINAEGGDVSMVWLPEGGVGVLIGYHRILRYIETRTAEPMDGKAVGEREIAEARAAFRKAFFGREILIVGERFLREPAAASPELIHADMIVNVLRTTRGLAAFVPTYERPPVDGIAQKRLPESVWRPVQAEYDGAAAMLSHRGYRVVRIPFRDHPDRTPVQVGSFIDERDGRQSLLLGKYPYHFTLPDGRNPQRELQRSLEGLDDAVATWTQEPSEAHWKNVTQSIADVWTGVDTTVTTPNPNYDGQARVYESEGIRVTPVPLYPTGEGGLHCLLLN